MKKLFSFLKINEVYTTLKKCAKIYKVIYIVLTCLSALGGLIFSIQALYFYGISALIYLIITIAAFLLILFIGLLTEALLLGFYIIVHNNFEELKLKGILNQNGEENLNNTNPLIDKLNNIKNLKNSGFLSDEEYEEKRKAIISEL